MTDLETEQIVEGDMDEEERRIADMVYGAMMRASSHSERGQQAREFRVGVSDLGYCSERTRRMLMQEVPEDTDYLLAFLGTAIGEHVEQAVVAAQPDALSQFEVEVRLEADDGHVYNVMGHPDLLIDNYLLDVKTNYGLALARRLGADQQKRFQRHCYAKGAHEGGFFGDIPLEDVKVGNIWVDRSGKEREVHVELEPYDETVVQEATFWLSNVVADYLAGRESEKEPPREVCAATCGFFETCRALDTDVTGLITDPVLVEAARLYHEGGLLEKQGRMMRSEAKAHLSDIRGSTGEFTIRWTHVNETLIAETRRRAYDRIDVKPIKR